MVYSAILSKKKTTNFGVKRFNSLGPQMDSFLYILRKK